jgi:hypothetical protein
VGFEQRKKNHNIASATTSFPNSVTTASLTDCGVTGLFVNFLGLEDTSIKLSLFFVSASYTKLIRRH